MGIGSIAIRNHECTYFSRSCTDSTEAGVIKRTFIIDTRMRWSIREKPSNLLTRWIEHGISAYMQLPRFQSIIMLPVPPVSTLLDIRPLFETVPSRGKVTFAYQVTGNTVEVQVEINAPVRAAGYPLPVKRARVQPGSQRDGTGNERYLLLRAGKRSAPISSPFLLWIRCMGSGSL